MNILNVKNYLRIKNKKYIVIKQFKGRGIKIEIKDSSGEIRLILDDDSLIEFNKSGRGIYHTNIERNKIRSALICGNSLLILTYNNLIYDYSFGEVDPKEMYKIKLIVDVVNKENMIFSGGVSRVVIMFFFIASLVVLLSLRIELIIIMTYCFIFIILFAIISSKISLYMYSVDRKEFIRFNNHNKKISTFGIDEVKRTFELCSSPVYKKKNRFCFFTIVKQNPEITYPLKCVSGFKELNEETKHNK